MTLLDYSFRERPVWRQRFDAHVRAWNRHMRRQVFVAYQTQPSFRAAYDARVALSFAA